MAEHPGRHLHPIRVIHILGCLALAGWFCWYGWQHHPLRAASGRGHRASRADQHPGDPLISTFPAVLEYRLALVRAVLPDLLGGLGVLALFSLGTGVYARRFEVWLEAHQAGEAAALRGLGLDQAALGANKDRKKGATL